MGIFRNKQSTLTNLLEILKIFFRFTYIEPFVVLGNLFPFFNLNFEYFLELFTVLFFACNFNVSAGNLGLFENSSIYFIRSNVNSMK